MQRKNKILVFGFKPYHNYNSNITENILSKLKENNTLRKELFDVKFEGEMFRKAIDKHSPSIIIGLGQCSTGKKIRIERKAANLQMESFGDKAGPIDKGGPDNIALNLKIPSDKDSWISYNAWDYVCNFAMYQIMRYIKGKEIKFGFIHIPYNYNRRKSLTKIKKLIQNIN